MPKYEDLIMDYYMMIEISLQDEQIISVTSKYGYDQKKLLELKDLIEKVRNLQSESAEKKGKQLQATFDFNKLLDRSKQHYTRCLKLSRIVFLENLNAQRSLNLKGYRPRAFNDWYMLSTSFYSTLLEDQKLLNELQSVNCSLKDVEYGIQLLHSLKVAKQHQLNAISNFQSHKHKFQKNYGKLRKEMVRFRKVLSIAFEFDFPTLELLRINVKS